ncbi:MAG: ribonuclease HI family protein [bacterium]
MLKKIKLYTDGGARGNPGPAGIGAVLKDGQDDIVAEISEYIGVATNNYAEYMALIKGLEKVKELGAEEVECFLDSELVVKQMRREYRVKDKNLAKLFTKVWNLSLWFKKITYKYIRREMNSEADKLVNAAIDLTSRKH